MCRCLALKRARSTSTKVETNDGRSRSIKALDRFLDRLVVSGLRFLLPLRPSRSPVVARPWLMSVAASSSSSRQWGVYTLTAATSDTSPSLLLVFDNQRYLFNAGEGTTRAFVARSAGFKKLETIFATRASSTALQGLPGEQSTLAAEIELIGCRSAADFGRASWRRIGGDQGQPRPTARCGPSASLFSLSCQEVRPLVHI